MQKNKTKKSHQKVFVKNVSNFHTQFRNFFFHLQNPLPDPKALLLSSVTIRISGFDMNGSFALRFLQGLGGNLI
jgi:hypothetical protein